MSDNVAPSSGTRLKSLDVIKGFIIFLIVFAHVYMCVPGDGSRGPASPVLSTLYMGLMVFFLISGYFYRPGRSAKDNIIKRAIQLIVPLIAMCCIFPLIMYGYLSLMGYQIDFVKEYSECLKALLGPLTMGRPFGDSQFLYYPYIASFVGSYFLQVMLVGFIIFYLVAPRIMGDTKKTVAAIVILLAIAAVLRETLPWQPPFYLILGIVSSTFMIVGAECGRVGLIQRIENGGLRNTKYLGTVLVAFVMTIVLVLLLNPGVQFDNNQFGEYGGWSIFPFFIIGCFASYWFITLSVIVSKIPGLNKFFSFLGKHTLAILSMHGFAATLIIPVLGYTLTNRAWFPEMNIAGILITIVFAIAFSIAVSEIGHRYVLPKVSALRGKA